MFSKIPYTFILQNTFFKKLSTVCFLSIALSMNWHDIYVTSLKITNTQNVIHYAKRINIDSPSATSGLWYCSTWDS